MLQKMSFGVLCLAAIISTNSHSDSLNVDAVKGGWSFDYEFTPGQTKTLSNWLFPTLNATCTIETEDPESQLTFVAIQNSGSIDGVELKTGQSMTISVHPNQVLRISAVKQAKVDITNHGAHNLVAKCATV